MRALKAGRLRKPGRSQGAFALVESLVAVLIVSIGLLGVCELVINALRAASAALSHTQAVQLVADMMERIRANPDARDAYDCASYSGGPSERGCAPSGAPALQCTARELAEDDLARWQALARQALPSVRAGKCEANVRYFAAEGGTEPSRYLVEISWLQQGGQSPLKLGGELFVAGGPGT